MPDLERALITERLVLEPLLPSHAPHFFAFLQDRRLYRYYAGRPPSSVAELEQRYLIWAQRMSADRSQTWLNYALRDRKEGYVGCVQATVADSVATIGYDVFPAFWKRGYAGEACRDLIRALRAEHGVETVVAVVDVENAASIRLLERLGFSRVWTGPSDDMPGHQDHRYELRANRGTNVPHR